MFFLSWKKKQWSHGLFTGVTIDVFVCTEVELEL